MNYLLIGAGVFVLLEVLGIDPLSWIKGVGTSVASPSNQTVNANQQSNITAPNTPQLIANYMLANHDDPNNLHTVWQWNYYYQAVRGVPGPDPSVVIPNDPDATTKMISLAEYWSGMQSLGFSGMGAIGRGINLYGVNYTPGRSNNPRALGSELRVKRLD